MRKAPGFAAPLGRVFANDFLDRRPLVEMIGDLIVSFEDPFTIGLSAPWGAGKTSVLTLLEARFIERDDSPVVCHFDAWLHEDVADPILSMSGLLAECIYRQSNSAKMRGITRRIVKSATQIAAASAPAIAAFVAGATAFAVGADHSLASGAAVAASKAAEETSKRLPESLAKRQAKEASDILGRREKFHEELADAVENLREVNGRSGSQILLIIDELDRCTPTFALRVFERIKHFFDVPGVVFLMSYDPKYVMSAAQAVYGPAFESERYFRRFIDIEVTLPESTKIEFTSREISRLALNAIPAVQHVSDFGLFLCQIVGFTRPSMSLRDIEQYLVAVKLALISFRGPAKLEAYLLPVILAQRYADPLAFKHSLQTNGPFGPMLQSVLPHFEDEKSSDRARILRASARLIDISQKQSAAIGTRAGQIAVDEFEENVLREFHNLANRSGKWINEYIGSALRLVSPTSRA